MCAEPSHCGATPCAGISYQQGDREDRRRGPVHRRPQQLRGQLKKASTCDLSAKTEGQHVDLHVTILLYSKHEGSLLKSAMGGAFCETWRNSMFCPGSGIALQSAFCKKFSCEFLTTK